MLNFNNFLTFGTGSAPVQIRDPLLYNGASIPGGEPARRSLEAWEPARRSLEAWEPARRSLEAWEPGGAQMRMIRISTALARVASPIMIIIRVTV